jgi:uncharacterized membrane protein YagU involved in acid resistance
MLKRGYGPFKTILLAGLVAGVLDLTAAVVTTLLRGRPPTRMLQSIASGLLGLDSYNGGLKTAALGVVLHFIIATGAAAVFYAASRKLTFLVRQAIVSGLLYGIAVYFFMQLVVLPLSAFPHRVTFPLSGVLIGLGVHMLCVGLPISLIVRRYS